MAEPKTQCAACGVEILVSTAKKAGGRCRPCATETRGQIEAGRRRAQQDKAFRASPVWKFWMRLVASDFATLHPAERVYLAVNELRGSVLNGGFNGYFTTFGARASAAEEGLKTLNALRSLELLRAARRLLMGEASDGPAADSNLSAALSDPAIDRQLVELDRQFYVVTDELWDKLQEFGLQQGFFPEPWPSERR